MRSAGRRSIRKVGVALAGVLFAVALGAQGVPGAGSSPTATPASAQGAPSFLLVLVDDQALNSFKRRYMPRTFEGIVDGGTRFTRALAAPPLCCPDRAGIITGQYPHNHGVFSNHPGYPMLTDPRNTLPVWLRRAGYRTALIGKFLNGYDIANGTTPAPGFDRWFELLSDPRNPYYGFRVSDQGRTRRYGHRRSDYSTDVLTREAKRFLRRQKGSFAPFFAWLAYNAPHLSTLHKGACEGQNPTPPDRAAYRRFAHTPLPRSLSFNEADVSDKPQEISSLPRLGPKRLSEVTRRWRCTLAAMRRVDVGVDKLIDELRRDGELSRTIVLYLSDNGYLFGEHRLDLGKGFVYEPSLRVPFAVRVPPAFRRSPLRRRVGALVSNQDLAPTMLRYANGNGAAAEPCLSSSDCRRMDGRSLEPLLGGEGTWTSERGVLAELDARTATPETGIDPQCDCAYEAIRTSRYLYSELSTGERELYDLRRDPDELTNRASSQAYADPEQRLAQRLAALEQCSGIEGRDPPAATPFCE